METGKDISEFEIFLYIFFTNIKRPNLELPRQQFILFDKFTLNYELIVNANETKVLNKYS